MWEIWEGTGKIGDYETTEKTLAGLFKDAKDWSLAIVIEIKEGKNRRVEKGYVFVERVKS